MVSNLVCLLNVQQETDYNAEIQDNVGFLFHVLDSRFQCSLSRDSRFQILGIPDSKGRIFHSTTKRFQESFQHLKIAEEKLLLLLDIQVFRDKGLLPLACPTILFLE